MRPHGLYDVMLFILFTANTSARTQHGSCLLAYCCNMCGGCRYCHVLQDRGGQRAQRLLAQDRLHEPPRCGGCPRNPSSRLVVVVQPAQVVMQPNHLLLHACPCVSSVLLAHTKTIGAGCARLSGRMLPMQLLQAPFTDTFSIHQGQQLLQATVVTLRRWWR